MGATGSVLEAETAGATFTKERCVELVGESFSEELWQQHSEDGVITREKLLELGHRESSSSSGEDTTAVASAGEKIGRYM